MNVSAYRPLALRSSLALPWSAYCSALNRFVYPHPSAGLRCAPVSCVSVCWTLFGRKPILDYQKSGKEEVCKAVTCPTFYFYHHSKKVTRPSKNFRSTEHRKDTRTIMYMLPHYPKHRDKEP